MSATEILVIGFGLFIGYWVVSKLIADKPRDAEPPRDAEAPHGDERK
jgi:hypothetical protein